MGFCNWFCVWPRFAILNKLCYTNYHISNKITRKLELVISCLGWKFPKKQTLIDNTETKLSLSTAVVKVTDVSAGCAHIGIVAQSKRRWKYLFLWSFFNTLLRYVWKNKYFSLKMLTDQIFLLFTFLTFLKRGAIDLKIKLVFHGIHIQYPRRELLETFLVASSRGYVAVGTNCCRLVILLTFQNWELWVFIFRSSPQSCCVKYAFLKIL